MHRLVHAVIEPILACKLSKMLRGARPPNVFDTLLRTQATIPVYLEHIQWVSMQVIYWADASYSSMILQRELTSEDWLEDSMYKAMHGQG